MSHKGNGYALTGLSIRTENHAMTETEVLLSNDAIETWYCVRLLNPRPTLFVYVVGKRRFLLSKGGELGKQATRVSRKSLEADGWRMKHRTTIRRGE